MPGRLGGKTMSRREFLGLGGGMALAVFLTACGARNNTTTQPVDGKPQWPTQRPTEQLPSFPDYVTVFTEGQALPPELDPSNLTQTIQAGETEVDIIEFGQSPQNSSGGLAATIYTISQRPNNPLSVTVQATEVAQKIVPR